MQLYYSDPIALHHENAPGHPEQPARIAAVEHALERAQLLDRMQRRPVVDATRKALEAVHDPAYVQSLFDVAPSEGHVQLDADTSMNAFTLSAALAAAGSAMDAVDQVVAGQASSAFINMRPPGHHAERDRAMGFCYFGSAALAAVFAREQLGLERVAVVDFDVHHGNGTEDLLKGREGILFLSSFQSPFYPGYYGENVEGQRINLPLATGCDGKEYRARTQQAWWPQLRDFAPELIIVSAGFDAHEHDPLGGLRLTSDDFARIGAQVMEQAALSAQGRVVSLLEGGYHLEALGESAAAYVEQCVV